MARAYSLDCGSGGWAVRGPTCRSVPGRHGQRGERCEWSQRHRASAVRLAEDGRAQALPCGARGIGSGADLREPDLTLRALLKNCRARLVVSYYALWHFLRMKDDVQKKSLRPPKGPARRPRRRDGGRRVRRRSTRSGLSSSTRPGQNQYDTHPWPMRRGERLLAQAPFGRWRLSRFCGVALRPAHRPASSTDRSMA